MCIVCLSASVLLRAAVVWTLHLLLCHIFTIISERNVTTLLIVINWLVTAHLLLLACIVLVYYIVTLSLPMSASLFCQYMSHTTGTSAIIWMCATWILSFVSCVVPRFLT